MAEKWIKSVLCPHSVVVSGFVLFILTIGGLLSGAVGGADVGVIAHDGFTSGVSEERTLTLTKHVSLGPVDIQRDGLYTKVNLAYQPTTTDGGLRMGYTSIPGRPLLPKVTLNFEINRWAEVKGVRVLYDGEERHPVDARIMPCPRPGIPTAGIPPTLHPDMSVYNSARWYPPKIYSYHIGVGLNITKGERVKYVSVALYPVRYMPLMNTIIYNKEFTVSVEYGFKDNAPKVRHSGTRAVYDMVIISPDSFQSSYSTYASWRTSMGINTKVVSLSDIYSGTYVSPQGRDDQERIKYFIKWAIENWNIKYVLLGGDADQIPVRYADVPDGFDDDNSYYIDGRLVPSDLYYGDIYDSSNNFCDWDANDNSVFGEWVSTDYNGGGYSPDDPDLYPDVYVGRIVASTSTELSGIINKLMTYYDNIDENGWFNNVVLCGTDTFDSSQGDYSGVAEGEYVCDYIYQNYLSSMNPTKCYASMGTATASAITNAINAGARFVAFSDHGQYNGWGYDSATSQSAIYTTSDVTSLGNQNKYPFVTVDACLTGGFDNEDANNPYSGSDSFAEEFMLNPNGGGIGVFAASRVGFGDLGTNYADHNSGYHAISMYYAYSQGYTKMGDMWGVAKARYLNNLGVSTVMDYKTLVEYTLFGDPTMAIEVGGLKLDISSSALSIKPSETRSVDISVSNNKAQDDTVAFTLSGVPNGWTCEVTPSPLTVPQHTTQSATLTVTAPSGALADEVVNINIDAQDGAGKHYTKALSVTVAQVVDLECSLDPESQESTGGESVSYTLAIDYRGNVQDTLSIEVTKPSSSWGVSLNSIKSDSITLPVQPFSSTSILVDVTPDQQAEAGSYDLSFTLSSQKDTSVSRSGSMTLNIAPFYSIALDTSYIESIGEVKPGSVVNTKIRVNNNGNIHDYVNLDLEVEHEFQPIFNDYNAYDHLGLTLNGERVGIEPFSYTDATLSISPDTGALAGDYRLTIHAFSEGDITVSDSVSVSITVSERYELGIDTSNQNLKLEDTPGKVQWANITLHNGGNTYDTFVISASMENGGRGEEWGLRYNSTIDVPPLSYQNISLAIIPPEGIKAGDYWGQVNVSSTGDPSQMAEVSIEFHVASVYAIGLDVRHNTQEVANGSSLEVGWAKGESVDLDITVYNNGNDDDEIYVRVEGEDGCEDVWDATLTTPLGGVDAYTGASGLTLDYAGDTNITLRISNIAIPLAGLHEFKLIVKSKGGTYVHTFYLDVGEHRAVDIVGMEMDGTACKNGSQIPMDKGKEGTLSLSLKNTGNCNLTLSIKVEGNGSGNVVDPGESITLAPGEEGVISIGIKAKDTGRIEFMPSVDNTPLGPYTDLIVKVKAGATTGGGGGGPVDIVNPFSEKGGSSGDAGWWLMLVIIMVVIICALIAGAIFVVRRKKAHRKGGEDWQNEPPRPPTQAQSSDAGGATRAGELGPAYPTATQLPPQPPQAHDGAVYSHSVNGNALGQSQVYGLPEYLTQEGNYTPAYHGGSPPSGVYVQDGAIEAYTSVQSTPLYGRVEQAQGTAGPPAPSKEPPNQRSTIKVISRSADADKEVDDDIESWFDDVATL